MVAKVSEERQKQTTQWWPRLPICPALSTVILCRWLTWAYKNQKKPPVTVKSSQRLSRKIPSIHLCHWYCGHNEYEQVVQRLFLARVLRFLDFEGALLAWMCVPPVMACQQNARYIRYVSSIVCRVEAAFAWVLVGVIHGWILKCKSKRVCLC